jgi:hypothetical protein
MKTDVGLHNTSRAIQVISSKRKQAKCKSKNFWGKYFYENGDVRYHARIFKLKNNMFVKLSKQILDEGSLKYQKNKNITLCVDAWREFKNHVETIDANFCINPDKLNQVGSTDSTIELIDNDNSSSISKVQRLSTSLIKVAKSNANKNASEKKECIPTQSSMSKAVPKPKYLFTNKTIHKRGRPVGSKNRNKIRDHSKISTEIDDISHDKQQAQVLKQPVKKRQRCKTNNLENNVQIQAKRSNTTKYISRIFF